MKALIALQVAAICAACATVPARDSIPPLSQGSAVMLSRPVKVGDLAVTPLAIVEDSRCPINARCVWAGRLMVRTRIDGVAAGARWSDTADLELGKPYQTRGGMIVLVSGEPGRTTDRPTRPDEYRFTYEAGWNVRTDPGRRLEE